MKNLILFVGFYAALIGALWLPVLGTGSAVAQSIMPVPNRPVTRPAPVRPRPIIRPSPIRPRPITRPSPVRPRPTRPSPGFSRPIVRPSPGYQKPIIRPSPGSVIKPPIGWTRPSPGYPALPVRPEPIRPPSPVVPDPGFDDRPTIINPPLHRPPFQRPPHYHWGSWLWYDNIGWYHRYRYRGNWIIIVEDLPYKCNERVKRSGQIYYRCSNAYYRSISIRGERVYEVTILKDDTKPAEISSNSTASDSSPIGRVLRLSKPLMRGYDVITLQRELKRRGYNVGVVDGVFGRATNRALKAFQSDIGVPADGVADKVSMSRLRG